MIGGMPETGLDNTGAEAHFYQDDKTGVVYAFRGNEVFPSAGFVLSPDLLTATALATFVGGDEPPFMIHDGIGYVQGDSAILALDLSTGVSTPSLSFDVALDGFMFTNCAITPVRRASDTLVTISAINVTQHTAKAAI
jgi:hypothetical protein